MHTDTKVILYELTKIRASIRGIVYGKSQGGKEAEGYRKEGGRVVG